MTDTVHVLVVEDNPGDLVLLRHQLARLDDARRYEIVHAERLSTAIDRLGAAAFDVVLLDLSLPDTLGVSTSRKLFDAVPDCPPVIVLTGNTDREAAVAAVAAGAQDFLVKGSFDHESLARSIRYAIERHRGRRELEEALQREQRMVEQLQQLDQLKNRFVAMASHELRTPLASIAGFAATLRLRWDAIPDANRLEYVSIIDDQSLRLSRLVDELLVLSKIESGSLDAHPEPIQLDRAIRLVLAELDAHEPDIVVEVADDVCVHADRDHLEQMLINYVSNALKYGETPISVRSRPSGDYVEVLVCDEGIGVPEDVRPVLFEEFVRGRDHTSSRIEGTGLGLSIVRGLARAQGGEAWYEPNLPTGAVFGLRLPIAG